MIDREDTCGEVYNLIVIAEEKATTERRRTMIPCQIYILDENDNGPTFSPTSYSASIYENSVYTGFVTVTVCNSIRVSLV